MVKRGGKRRLIGRTIKDYWRPDIKDVEREDSIYALLHQNDVSNVPTCMCGEDVTSADGVPQRTTAPSVANPEHLYPYVHYRTLLEEIELSGFMVDAMTAHQRAWADAQILNRQVGVNSIGIFARRKRQTVGGKTKCIVTRVALLCDWESSKSLMQIETGEGPRQYAMVGSWYFRSALSVLYPLRRECRLADEIESFIHVFHYLVLRFCKTELSERDESLNTLCNIIRLVYASYVRAVDSKVHTGSYEKLTHLRANGESWILPCGIPALGDLLDEIGQLTCEHLAPISLKVYRRIYGTDTDPAIFERYAHANVWQGGKNWKKGADVFKRARLTAFHESFYVNTLVRAEPPERDESNRVTKKQKTRAGVEAKT
ncbi:uncharacterized protein BXZ73DRAFT_104146 [Epithele typhae]|uniref:uncharacterized protein n=1 Tax=Epithele typhae TaxID=378194 RepID=UPI0020072F57|nr:uncharacterized protein BXZ73DRAFT_104146 [Epithele typhae]KAH9922328.1 hypothetical protein BXZ73DRAFT_104146 [Epithele typhae]